LYNARLEPTIYDQWRWLLHFGTFDSGRWSHNIHNQWEDLLWGLRQCMPLWSWNYICNIWVLCLIATDCRKWIKKREIVFNVYSCLSNPSPMIVISRSFHLQIFSGILMVCTCAEMEEINPSFPVRKRQLTCTGKDKWHVLFVVVLGVQ